MRIAHKVTDHHLHHERQCRAAMTIPKCNNHYKVTTQHSHFLIESSMPTSNPTWFVLTSNYFSNLIAYSQYKYIQSHWRASSLCWSSATKSSITTSVELSPKVGHSQNRGPRMPIPAPHFSLCLSSVVFTHCKFSMSQRLSWIFVVRDIGRRVSLHLLLKGVRDLTHTSRCKIHHTLKD